MEELVISPWLLATFFICVAFVYSAVGLGGGSSYTALMAIFGVNYVAIPTISLALNLLVTSAGSFNFIRKKHARLRLILPFLITSIPMSYLGGTLAVPKEIFYWILLTSLIFVAFRIYVWKNTSMRLSIGEFQRIALSLVSGSLLGLIAGIVGIGGGIYLVPLIIILGLGSVKEAAACGSIFIWANSFSGLVARFHYHSVDLAVFVPIILAVFVGGILGSHMGSSRFQPRTMEKILGAIIVLAIYFLSKKILFS